jgi:dihydropyrimidine dehydrogenase (NADP+)/dihydropyrimidine dehydrogenase (NAD+) subunit PreA
MEEYNREAWIEIVQRCEEAGVDAFELNFSCPHGLPERKMGAAMGQCPEILEEVCTWVSSAATRPVWAKMTPNVTHIEEPSRAALRGGCEGLSAINTIRSVMGVNLDTLRPEPSVEGYTTPGGYSSKAVRPIALRMCMEIATMIRNEFPGRSLSGMGGVESGSDAAQFILLGSDTVQVCTGVMKFGYECVKPMCDELLALWRSTASRRSRTLKARAWNTSPRTLISCAGRPNGKAGSESRRSKEGRIGRRGVERRQLRPAVDALAGG